MAWLRSKLDKNDDETFSPQSRVPLLDPTSPQPTPTFSPAMDSPLLSDRPDIRRSITTAIDTPHSQVLGQVQGKSTAALLPSPPVSPPKSASTRARNPSTRPTILPQTTTEAHSYSLGGFMQSAGHSAMAGGNRSAAASTVKLPRSFSTELLPTADDVYGEGTIADILYEPFTGAPVARLSMPVKKDTLSPAVATGPSSGTPARTEDPTRQTMWDYLAHIRGLQAEIAALHLTMDGAGIGTSPALTTGGGKGRGSVGAGVGRAELGRRTSVADPEDMLGSAGGEEGMAESRLGGEGKTHTVTEKEKEAKLDAEFAQFSALFAGKREAMNQIMTKLRELSTLVRGYHDLVPPDPSRASPSRGNPVDSAPLTLDGHLVLTAREPLTPRSSDTEPPSPMHLDYPPGSANLQGQAGPSASAKFAKLQIAPILTTSPSSSMPGTPTVHPVHYSQSAAAVTQHPATYTSSETANRPASSPLISSPPTGAPMDNPGASHGYISENPGSGVAPLSAAPQVHSASQMQTDKSTL